MLVQQSQQPQQIAVHIAMQLQLVLNALMGIIWILHANNAPEQIVKLAQVEQQHAQLAPMVIL